MPEARAVSKLDGDHSKRRLTVESDQAAQNAQVVTAPAPALASRLGATPPNDLAEHHRVTLQRLPSTALRQQFVSALVRQYGNVHVQRVLAPTLDSQATADVGAENHQPKLRQTNGPDGGAGARHDTAEAIPNLAEDNRLDSPQQTDTPSSGGATVATGGALQATNAALAVPTKPEQTGGAAIDDATSRASVPGALPATQAATGLLGTNPPANGLTSGLDDSSANTASATLSPAGPNGDLSTTKPTGTEIPSTAQVSAEQTAAPGGPPKVPEASSNPSDAQTRNAPATDQNGMESPGPAGAEPAANAPAEPGEAKKAPGETQAAGTGDAGPAQATMAPATGGLGESAPAAHSAEDHGTSTVGGTPDSADATTSMPDVGSNPTLDGANPAPPVGPPDDVAAGVPGGEAGGGGPPEPLGDPARDRTAQEILAAAETEKAAITQSGATEQQSILQHADVQAKALVTTADTHAGALEGAVTQHKAQLSDHVTTGRAQVLQALETHKATALGSGSQAVNAVQQHGATHGKAVSDTAQGQTQQVDRAGSDQGQRATSSAQAAAGQVTNAARSPNASGMVGKLLGGLRDRLLGGIGPGIQKFAQHGADLARGAAGMVSRVAQGLRNAASKVVSDIGNTVVKVTQKVKQATESLISHLVTVATRVVRALEGALKTAMGALNKLLDGVAALRKAGQDAASATKRTAQTVAGHVQTAVRAGVGQQDNLARRMIDVLRTHGTSGVAPAALTTFSQSAVGALRKSRTDLAGAIGEHAGEARSRLGQLVPAFSTHLAKGTQRVQGQLTTTVNGFTGAVRDAGQDTNTTLARATGAGQQAHQQATQQFDAQTGQAATKTGQGLIGAATKAIADIASKITAGVQEHGTAKQNAVGQINNYTQSVSAQVAGKDKGWWEGIKEGASEFFSGLSRFVLYVELGAVVVLAGMLAGGAVLSLEAVGVALAISATIIGLYYLIYGLILDWQRRWEQYKTRPDYASQSTFEKFIAWVGTGVVAILDVVGIGLIIEAIWGYDLVTGRKLTDEEKGIRLSMGLLTFLTLILARKADEALRGGEKPAVPGPEDVPPADADPATDGRVTTKVPGLYDGIDPATTPSGWKFVDTVLPLGKETVVTTEVTAPDGSTGHVQRGLDPTTNTFVMHEAFLDQIPKDIRWIPTDPPMVPGKGTPLETYLTMRQMKLLESKTRGAGASSGPRVVAMSRIVNVRTVLELAAKERKGVPRDQAVLDTHSVSYANNSIVQSGGRITKAHVEGGILRPAGKLNDVTPEMLKEYGLSPTDDVLYFFDIILDVEPVSAPSGSKPGTPPVPATGR